MEHPHSVDSDVVLDHLSYRDTTNDIFNRLSRAHVLLLAQLASPGPRSAAYEPRLAIEVWTRHPLEVKGGVQNLKGIEGRRG